MVYSYNFIRNANYIGGITNISQDETNIVSYRLSDDKEIEVEYHVDYLTIKDCYKLNKDERLELLSYIYCSNQIKNKSTRSIQSMEGELALHVYLYDLGIEKASTKDADLEFGYDNRWYVRLFSSVLQILGV